MTTKIQRNGSPESGAAQPAASGIRGRIRSALDGSVWPSLGGKVALYVVGFFALALVGSGDLLRLLPRGPGTGAALSLVYGPATAAAATQASAPVASAALPVQPDAADAGADAPGADASIEPAAPAACVDGGTPSGGVTADGKVVLNVATEQDLERLPGIGPAKAAAILALRTKLKRFQRIEDLLRVKGLGRRSLSRLRPLVLLDPP